MPKINFAIWNIDRAAAKPDDPLHPPKKICERAASIRIVQLLQKTDLDFIFLQEVPDPNRIKILSPSENMWIPASDDELKKHGCKCLHENNFLQGIWVPHPDWEHLCSGILFLLTEHGRKQNLAFQKIELFTRDPIGMGCSIFHTGDSQKNLLRFIGFWNSSKNNYLQHLKNFLNRSLDHLDKETLQKSLVTGDTNVNVRTENEIPGEWTEDGKLLIGYMEKKGLTLINGNADQYTHRWKHSKKWYRCDLLMASACAKINSVSLGKETDYMWKRSDSAGSDHLPLFFSYSYNLPKEER